MNLKLKKEQNKTKIRLSNNQLKALHFLNVLLHRDTLIQHKPTKYTIL